MLRKVDLVSGAMCKQVTASSDCKLVTPERFNQKDRRQVCILSEKMATHFSRVNGMESIIFYSGIKVS